MTCSPKTVRQADHSSGTMYKETVADAKDICIKNCFLVFSSRWITSLLHKNAVFDNVKAKGLTDF